MAIGRIAYRSGLALLAVYFYAQGNGLWIACVLLLAWSVFQQQVAAIVGTLGKLANIPLEHDANSVLIYTFSIEKVLEHPCLDALFNALQKNGKARRRLMLNSKLSSWTATPGSTHQQPRHAKSDSTSRTTFCS